MKYRIEIKKPFKVAGIEIQTSPERASKEIGQLWQKFVAETVEEQIPHKEHFNVFALYSDYASQHDDYCEPGTVNGPIDHYSYLIGCQVSKLDNMPVGFVAKGVPEGRYAVFTAQGNFPESLVKAWETINNLNLERTYLYDFEDYRDFETAAKTVIIYVGIN